MQIYKYEIISPMTIRTKPFIDSRGKFVIPNINKQYKWYLEANRYNPVTLYKEYFVLISETQFNEHCRKCKVDNKGRLILDIHGEVEDYIKSEAKVRGNVNFDYYESTDYYDVFIIV